MEKFIMQRNTFLSTEIRGYYNRGYVTYKQQEKRDILLVFKNTFDTESEHNLNAAKNEIVEILLNDIPIVIKENKLNECICVCVPRAKALNTYMPTQLYFLDAISCAASKIQGVIDGTEFIIRHTNTRTTHLGEKVARETKTGRVDINEGDLPYPGITKATCRINENVRGKNIILIDDIYTKGTNIDEDCVQALMDSGANTVIFYAVGYTGR